jgi:hypothetical protein
MTYLTLINSVSGTTPVHKLMDWKGRKSCWSIESAFATPFHIWPSLTIFDPFAMLSTCSSVQQPWFECNGCTTEYSHFVVHDVWKTVDGCSCKRNRTQESYQAYARHCQPHRINKLRLRQEGSGKWRGDSSEVLANWRLRQQYEIYNRRVVFT